MILLEGSMFVNDVTVVVNCYDIVSSNPVDCKCAVLKYISKGNSLEYKYGCYMFEGMQINELHLTKFVTTIHSTILQQSKVVCLTNM